MNEDLLKIAQEEYARQLFEYLTNPTKKPDPTIKELIEKYFKNNLINDLNGESKK